MGKFCIFLVVLLGVIWRGDAAQTVEQKLREDSDLSQVFIRKNNFRKVEKDCKKC